MLKQLALAALIVASCWSTTPRAQALGTAFTYQGELRSAVGAVANGTHDFEFKLFDAAIAGAQVGATVSLNAISVSNGIFTAALDFGDQFTGQKRFLSIAVRQTGQPTFDNLAPRQELRPAPYAQHADFVADGTVVGASILDGSLSTADYANLSVTSAKLADGSVTTAKIAANAVTGAKIANGAVGLVQINTSEVQARVSGSCPSGQPLLGFTNAGALICDEAIAPIGEVTLPSGGSRLSIALRSNGNPVISYQNGTNELRLLNCLDDLCNERNFLFPVTASHPDGYSSIAVRSDNMPIIAYANNITLIGNFLRLADCNSTDCASVTNRNLHTTGLPLGTVDQLAMAMRASDLPFIAFHDIANTGLYAYDCDDSDCATGNVRNLVTANDTGFQPSVAIRASGRPIIAYKDVTNGDLRVWDCNNADCTTGTERIVDSVAADTGSESSIAQNSLGDILIAYRDEGNDVLRVAHCELADCDNSTASNNSSTTIDSNTGTYPVLLIRADDRPLIFYRDNRNAELDLRVYDCANIKCTSGSSSIVEGGQGQDRGKWVEAVLRSTGRPVVVSNDLDINRLRVTNCANETCINP